MTHFSTSLDINNSKNLHLKDKNLKKENNKVIILNVENIPRNCLSS